MLLKKQQEVIQWCMEHNATISLELIKLWDEAMKLGEEEGKKMYQEFLNKWQEFQKNPQKGFAIFYNGTYKEPTEWQKMLIQKQQEIMQLAQKYKIEITKEMIDLWNKAMSLGEKEGQKLYDEFLQMWDNLFKPHQDNKEEPLAGQQTRNQPGYEYNNGIDYAKL